MSVFEFREWLERSVPIWVLTIPVAVAAIVGMIAVFGHLIMQACDGSDP